MDQMFFAGMPMFFKLFFGFVFTMVVSIFFFVIIKGIKEWSYNNSQPILDVDARVVSKRTEVSRRAHSSGDNMHHHHSSTTYYVTFEVDSGDRMELMMPGREYGMIAEGDKGKLKFQGRRYHEFNRYK